MKFKYQGGLTKIVASKIGEKNKKKFIKFIEKKLSTLTSIKSDNQIQLDVVSFSSSHDFYEQVLSILSFLRYLGTPDSWTVYSDGSHTAEQINFLKVGFEFVQVRINEWKDTVQLSSCCKDTLIPYKTCLFDYAENMPLGKKLFCYLNHEIKKPTLFLDSDIIFYRKATVMEMILREKVNGWYLPDEGWGTLDSRYKNSNIAKSYQPNSGFFLLNQELTRVEKGMNFLKSLNLKYEYFSEQTVIYILFECNNFMPLDPRMFILNSEDQFDFSYLYSRDKMAVRHYTGPVRHKMWQKDWKWHLSLS